MKRFIDDIANDVIEAKLVLSLADIFTPVAVFAMSADLVTSIAGESEESRAQREQLTKQLDVLTKGSDTCKRFIGVRLLSKKAATCFGSGLLISYVGTDDDATQSDTSSSNGRDEGSEILLMEDL